MRIIKQSSRILNISHSDPLKAIELAARNCYQSKEGNTEKLIKNLINVGHWSPFEMVDVQVELITSRGVMAEITRHRICSFNIESSRFCNYKDGFNVILPIEFYNDNNIILYDEWFESMINSEKSYQRMVEYGSSPQLARDVAPNALKTNIIMKTNIRDWVNIFKLRTEKGSHPQMIELMTNLKKQFQERIPIIFD